MSGYIEPFKIQYNKESTVLTPPNKSPTKQTFTSIKNFLKNKSSFTDLRVWQDSKKDEHKDIKNSILLSNTELESIVDDRKNEKSIYKSKSATRLSEFKLKGPKKKRSFGSLGSQSQQESMLSPYENASQLNDSVEQINIANNFKQCSTLNSGSTQKSLPLVSASSPQFNIFRNSSTSTSTSIKSKSTANTNKSKSPSKAAFSLDVHETPSTPQLPLTNTFDSISSKEWYPPTTIRGTYLHDWSNNTSPRSLSESLKVGKVEKHSGTHESIKPELFKPTLNTLDSESSIGAHSNLNSYNDNCNFKMKINISDLVEPGTPLPSPCTINAKNGTSYISAQDIENSSSTLHIASTDSQLHLRLESTRTNGNSNSNSNLSSISTDNTEDDFDDSSHSVTSRNSQFSFLRNRTSSIKFYKSNEQMAKELEIDEDRKERQKIKDFLGTSGEAESEFLNELSSNSKTFDNVYDDDVNYIDYDEEDETDALFNRDLFGLNEEEKNPKASKLKLEINYNYEDENDETDYDFETPTRLGTIDDDYKFKAPNCLELTDDENDDQFHLLLSNDVELYDNGNNHKNLNKLELSHDGLNHQLLKDMKHDDKYDSKPANNLEFSDDEYAYKPPNNLELSDSNEHESDFTPLSNVELRDDDETGRGFEYKLPNGLELHDKKENIDIAPKTSSSSFIKSKKLEDQKVNKKENNEKEKSSSNSLLEMLNNPGLPFKPNTAEINIKHIPSAKLRKHKSIKFHQLSGDIEDENLTIHQTISNKSMDNIWESPTLLDEVNSIPEDFEFETYNEFKPSLLKKKNNSRLSTLFAAPKSDNGDCVKFGDNISHSGNNKQHLWKNLISTNGAANSAIEKIKLNNRTITLYNHSNIEKVKDTSDGIDENEGTGNGDLSTIME